MMCLLAGYKKKNMKKKYFFASFQSMKSDLELDPDPLVRGTGPGILDPDPHQNVLVPNIDNKTFRSLRTYQMYTTLLYISSYTLPIVSKSVLITV